MKKCKITVVGAYFLEDLAKEYASLALGQCELHTVGQVYYSNGWQKPKGFCDNAWKSMQEYVMTLAHGGRNIFNGGWVNDEKIAIVCCNDGLRPVSFKIEATDEDAEVFVES